MRLQRSAFTIVEVLVVIGVIAILMGLLMPVMSSIRAESKSTHCLSNLRQLFTALQTSRSQQKDLLPFAAPLPEPNDQIAFVPGLPERLSAILPRNAETWMCPADDSEDGEALGTSYTYLAGAFMLVLPPLIADPSQPLPTLQQQIDRAMRVITQRYSNGDLSKIPLLVDTSENHRSGSRDPRNGVFFDGNARVLQPADRVLEEEP